MNGGLSPSPSVVTHDHHLQVRLHDLIRDRTGLWFGPQRHAALSAAVEAARGGDSLPVYLSRLTEAATDTPLWEALISRLTVGETYFFREPEQIEALRTHLLPEIIARRRAEKTLRIWSAGCATGEEPYTLAILLRDLVPDLGSWRVQVLGTDLNRPALAQAAAGRYRAWSFRQVSPAVRRQFFVEKEAGFELDPAIRQMVTFRYLNLAEADYPSPVNGTAQVDLILCRNVTIYLPADVIRAIAGRFLKCLAPGGWLMVGPSEANDTHYAGFEPIHYPTATAYRRPAHSALPPGAPPSAVSPVSEVPTLPASSPRRPGPVEAHRRALPPPLSAARASAQARLAADAGRLEEACRWAEQALQTEPLHRDAHYVLALVHQERGELAAAAARYRKVLYLDPAGVLAHYQLALVLRALGQPAEAVRHEAQAARLAAQLPPDRCLEGADELTASGLLALLTPSRTPEQRP